MFSNTLLKSTNNAIFAFVFVSFCLAGIKTSFRSLTVNIFRLEVFFSYTDTERTGSGKWFGLYLLQTMGMKAQWYECGCKTIKTFLQNHSV